MRYTVKRGMGDCVCQRKEMCMAAETIQDKAPWPRARATRWTHTHTNAMCVNVVARPCETQVEEHHMALRQAKNEDTRERGSLLLSRQGNENSAVQRKESTNFDMMAFSGSRRKNNKDAMQERRDLQAVSFVPVSHLSVARHDEENVVEW